MKSESEVREKIKSLEKARKDYLMIHGHATAYSRKIYHYRRTLLWVIGELDEYKLGVRRYRV